MRDSPILTLNPLGDFSLDLENRSVRSILNSVIQTSRTKYWFIKRDEENKEFFLINF